MTGFLVIAFVIPVIDGINPFVIVKLKHNHIYNGKTQRQMAEEMGMTKQVFAHYDNMKKGTTLKALSSALDNDKDDKKKMS